MHRWETTLPRSLAVETLRLDVPTTVGHKHEAVLRRLACVPPRFPWPKPQAVAVPRRLGLVVYPETNDKITLEFSPARYHR